MKDSSKKPEDTQGWPSLQEQLSAAKVIPGSALEKLIKDNQDFEMLDTGERNDKSLPPSSA